MHKRSAKYSGFTLIELIVTVSLAAILMAMAIPSFTEAIRSNRLTTYANEFIAALNFARSEAIKRGVQVTVRRKGTNSQVWEEGWDVFVDSDENETFNDDADSDLCEANADGSPSEDCLLKTYPALLRATLRTGSSTYKDYAAYLASGLSQNGAGEEFRLCYGTDANLSRAIIMNSTGRARVSTGTSSCP
ncbi:MAG: GspH/FimT family pseudopilin [Methylosarcina sp.]